MGTLPTLTCSIDSQTMPKYMCRVNWQEWMDPMTPGFAVRGKLKHHSRALLHSPPSPGTWRLQFPCFCICRMIVAFREAPSFSLRALRDESKSMNRAQGRSRNEAPGTLNPKWTQSCDLVCSQLRLILSPPPEGSSPLELSSIVPPPCSLLDVSLPRHGDLLRSSRPVVSAPTPPTLSP